MLISAISAFFLITFGLGAFWRSEKLDILLFSFASVVRSFYIAWFVFLVSYFTTFGKVLPALSILTAGAAAVILLRKFETGNVGLPKFNGSSAGRTLFFGVLTIALGVTFVVALRPIGDIFTAWDALASWNRWATELSDNRYNPMNTAYPIMMPALWSLIYEAQSTTAIWFFSRAILSVIPLAVVALVAYAGLRHGIIPFLALFVALLFGFILKEPLFSGYMDQPSAVLGVACLLAAVLALWEADERRRNELLTLSVITAAIAVLTKQHAIFAAFSVCSLVGVLAVRRQISFVRAAVLAALFLAPVASYLYIYLQEQDTLWGNLSTLNQVANSKVGEQPKIVAAFKTIWAELPAWIWAMLAVGTLANLAFFRRPQAWFAMLIAGLTLPGFLTYADCCSYSERNGIWILGHLSVSAYIGFALMVEALARQQKLPAWLSAGNFDTSVSDTKISPQSIYVSAALLAVGLVLISGDWPMSRLMERQIAQQRYRIETRTQAILVRQPGITSFATDLVTPVQLMKFHPDITQKFHYCKPMKASCFDGTPAGKTLFVTADWFENSDSLAEIQSQVEAGNLRLIAEEKGMRMYKVDREIK